MTAPALLDVLRAAGIVLTAAGDRIEYDAPVGAMTPEVRAELRERKTELLPLLEAKELRRYSLDRGQPYAAATLRSPARAPAPAGVSSGPADDGADPFSR